jgi:hypothetical protein
MPLVGGQQGLLGNAACGPDPEDGRVECRLEIRTVRPIGMADELVHAVDEGAHWRKHRNRRLENPAEAVMKDHVRFLVTPTTAEADVLRPRLATARLAS